MCFGGNCVLLQASQHTSERERIHVRHSCLDVATSKDVDAQLVVAACDREAMVVALAYWRSGHGHWSVVIAICLPRVSESTTIAHLLAISSGFTSEGAPGLYTNMVPR